MSKIVKEVCVLKIIDIWTKLPFTLFGQINQHFALLPKLNREMPSFKNRVFQNRVKPYSDVFNDL